MTGSLGMEAGIIIHWVDSLIGPEVIHAREVIDYERNGNAFEDGERWVEDIGAGG